MPEKIIVEAIIGKLGQRGGAGGKDSSVPPRSEEVEGRTVYSVIVICPHCGAHRFIQMTDADRNFWQWYTCGHCGQNYYY